MAMAMAGEQEHAQTQQSIVGSSLLWFKLLFVPAVGVFLLALFLVDDARQSKANSNNQHGNNQLIAPAIAMPAPSSSSPPHIPPHLLSSGTRLIVWPPAGPASAYKIANKITAKELIAFFAQRNNIQTEGLFLAMDGRRLADSSILDPASLSPSPVVSVELDYEYMNQLINSEGAKELAALSALLDRESAALCDAECCMASTIEALVDRQGEVARLNEEASKLKIDKQKIQQMLEAAVDGVNEQKRLRKKKEDDKGDLERALLIPQARERGKLEKQIKETRNANNELKKTIEDAQANTAKQNRDTQSMAARLLENAARKEHLLREIDRENERGDKAAQLQAALEAAEARDRDEAAKKRKEVDALACDIEDQERELSDYQQLIAAATSSTTPNSAAAAVNSIDDPVEGLEQQLAQQKARHKQLEAGVKELAKWRSVSAKFEAEAKELSKCRALAKQTKMREKFLEKDLKDVAHWKQRVRAFDREVKELRAFRRHAVELSQLKGWPIPVPPITMDGADGDGAAPVSAYAAAYEPEGGWAESRTSASEPDDFFDSVDVDGLGLEDFASSTDYHSASDEDALPPVHMMTAAITGAQAQRFYGSSGLHPAAREFVPRTAVGVPANGLGSLSFQSSSSSSSPSLGSYFPSTWSVSSPFDSSFDHGVGVGVSPVSSLPSAPLNKPGLLIIDDRENTGRSSAANNSTLSALNASSYELGRYNTNNMNMQNHSQSQQGQGQPHSHSLMGQQPPALANLSSLSSSLASVLASLNHNSNAASAPPLLSAIGHAGHGSPTHRAD